MRVRRMVVVLLGLLLVCLTVASPAGAAPALPGSNPGAPTPPGPPSSGPGAPVPAKGTPYEPGVLLVGYRPGAQAAERAAVYQAVGAVAVSEVSPLAGDLERLRLGPSLSVEQAVKALAGNKGVRYAEPNYLLEPTAISDDPYFTGGSEWGMAGEASTPANVNGSRAAEAWAAGRTGSRQVVVGVVDEGIQVTHPDLAANIWTNPGEIAGNGIDDDGNGYVDDVNGFDFANNDGTVYDGPADDHATHVAGTIGGIGGNGTGVAGVNWAVTLISAKFLGTSGGTTANAIRALDYLTDLKARYGLNLVATNNSWGGGGFSQALLDAIDRGGDRGITFVAAAGNSATNNDASPYYPSGYQCTGGGTRSWDCVVSVSAIDSSGNQASFSSYGAGTVDLGAPGVGVYSTVPDRTYGAMSGTSMAAPHVTGALALCASANPAIGAEALRAAVVESTAPTRSLAARTVNGGRLDVVRMLQRCTQPDGVLSGAPTALSGAALLPTQLRLQWTDGATGESGYEVERAAVVAGACDVFAPVARIGADTKEFFDGGLTSATSYCYRVRAVTTSARTAWAGPVKVTTLEAPSPYVCAGDPFAWIDATAGTQQLLGDDAALAVTLPFAFPFYGTATTTLTIGSNGYVRFGTGAATAFANAAIPTLADPNAIAAPWWDDLNPAAAGAVWSHTVGTAPSRSFVVAWLGVPVYGVANSAISFEVVLDEASGAIRFQYLDTVAGASSSDYGRSATVGIEDALGATGTQLGYNRAFLADNTSYRCVQQVQNAPLSVTTTALNAATVGTAYTQVLTATGGAGGYTWSVGAGSLPSGLALDGATGTVAGSPTTAGTVTFTAAVTDRTGAVATKVLTLTVTDVVSVPTSSLAPATTGAAYAATLVASGGSGGYRWAVTGGALPTGLSLASSTGVISGTPSDTVVTTTVVFTVTVTDSSGRSASKAMNLSVAPPVSVATASLAQASVGLPYRQPLVATGGLGTYGWTVTAGALPAGVLLGSDGVLTGTAAAAQKASFTATATDGEGRKGSKSYTLTVAGASAPDAFNKSTPKNGSTGVLLKPTLSWAAANLADGYEYCVDTTNNNVCDSGSWVPVGTVRSIAISGLVARTVYYWQVRAVNTSGATEANNGSWWKFTTGTK